LRTLPGLIALTCACAPAASRPPNTLHVAPALPDASATSATNATPTTPDTAHCEWSKRRPTASAEGATRQGDEQIDIVRLAIGLPPRTDTEKESDAEQARIDDALEGSIGCEVAEVRGKLTASAYAFAVDQVLDEVARCLHEPGRPRKEAISVRLTFDDRGQPRRARVEQPMLEARAATCIERILSEVRPASDVGERDTLPLTNDAQANASALVRLELDMPAAR
jgi:hypothetical protein